MENSREYICYLNWEDNMKNIRKVGYFAYIQQNFYLLVSGRETAKTAYENGFIGIPAIRPDEIYRSPELFNFFRNRILNKDSKDLCGELLENEGKSRIDSFSLEEVPEILADRQKQTLLEAYKKQEELKQLKSKKSEDIEINA